MQGKAPPALGWQREQQGGVSKSLHSVSREEELARKGEGEGG